MFRTKLTALDYVNAKDFNVYCEGEFRNLIIWLEDQVIRHYAIEERAGLRDVKNDRWENDFLEPYLVAVGCPFDAAKQRAEVTDWLLGFAVRLEFADGGDKLKNLTAESIKEQSKKGPQVVQKNPLDNIDFESDEFRGCIKSLCQLLNVTSHPDHLVTTAALCTIIRRHFSKQALANGKTKKQVGKPFPLDQMKDCMETRDPVVAKVLKILHLLYIHDLRSLQTSINECIVAVQGVTANPKTDTRLGKVGR